MEWTIGPMPDNANQQLVLIRGDMDLYDAPRLAEALITHLDAGNRHLVIDMANVEYLDSTGVGVIIRLLQRSKSNGGSVMFRGIHGSPRSVLVMSNVISLIKECDAVALKGAKR